MATPKKKGKNRLKLHNDGECGCSITQNPNNCVYQIFPDGWSFVPDVGNGQLRGEIFTPRFIVDKMIADSGMLPREAVYNQNYSGTEEELNKYISYRIVEPAIGTANFSATILYYKLRQARHLAGDSKEKLQELFLTAVASMYSYDIDPGNIEVAKRRMIHGDSTELNDDKVVDWWVKYITENVGEPDANEIKKMVTESLEKAQEMWHGFLNGDGVVTAAYKEFTGEDLPESLEKKMISILDDNAKLFNGLTEEDTGSMPGWGNVHWIWWNSDGEPEEKISMKKQILTSQVEEVERKIKDIQDKHFLPKSNSSADEGSLFDDIEQEIVYEWDDKKNEREYKKLLKEKEKLVEQLD